MGTRLLGVKAFKTGLGHFWAFPLGPPGTPLAMCIWDLSWYNHRSRLVLALPRPGALNLPILSLFKILFSPSWHLIHLFLFLKHCIEISSTLMTEFFCLPLTFCASLQFSSVAQSCPTLCNPTNRSTPGLPVHHQLPELTQTHVRRVGDAIQPSHPYSS